MKYVEEKSFIFYCPECRQKMRVPVEMSKTYHPCPSCGITCFLQPAKKNKKNYFVAECRECKAKVQHPKKMHLQCSYCPHCRTYNCWDDPDSWRFFTWDELKAFLLFGTLIALAIIFFPIVIVFLFFFPFLAIPSGR